MLSLLAMTQISNIHRGAYVVGVALAVAIVALVLAFGDHVGGQAGRTRRPRGVVAATVLGLIAFVFCGFALAGFLIFRTELNQYANCMNAANTHRHPDGLPEPARQLGPQRDQLLGGN